MNYNEWNYEDYRDFLIEKGIKYFSDLDATEKRELIDLYYIYNVSPSESCDVLVECLPAADMKDFLVNSIFPTSIDKSSPLILNALKSLYVGIIEKDFDQNVSDYEHEQKSKR